MCFDSHELWTLRCFRNRNFGVGVCDALHNVWFSCLTIGCSHFFSGQ